MQRTIEFEFGQRRDHDDGNFPKSRIILEQGENVISADARHHQIEQHEIEGLFFDQSERGSAILSLKHGMPLALQATGQKVSVRRIVVHHQNPAGLYGRAVGFLRRRWGGPP